MLCGIFADICERVTAYKASVVVRIMESADNQYIFLWRIKLIIYKATDIIIRMYILLPNDENSHCFVCEDPHFPRDR
jgi:hypothetical protein